MIDILIIICCVILLILLYANRQKEADLTIIFYPLLFLMIEFCFYHFNNKLDYKYVYYTLQSVVIGVTAYTGVHYYLKGRDDNEAS